MTIVQNTIIAFAMALGATLPSAAQPAGVVFNTSDIERCPPPPEKRWFCVHDGDTLWLPIPSGDEQRTHMRLYAIDTPEIGAQWTCGGSDEIALGQKAANRLVEILREVGTVYIEMHGPDKFQRELVTLRDQKGRDLSMVLVDEGLAVIYRQPEPWCH